MTFAGCIGSGSGVLEGLFTGTVGLARFLARIQVIQIVELLTLVTFLLEIDLQLLLIHIRTLAVVAEYALALRHVGSSTSYRPRLGAFSHCIILAQHAC